MRGCDVRGQTPNREEIGIHLDQHVRRLRQRAPQPPHVQRPRQRLGGTGQPILLKVSKKQNDTYALVIVITLGHM